MTEYVTPRSIIDEHIATKLETFRRDPQTVIGHIRQERSVRNDYMGRAPFELLQNALDRAQRKVKLKLCRETMSFSVSNDGIPFSFQKAKDDSWSDFAAICAINSSNKEVGKSIGNKGVGFRSIWEFCNQVQIVSRLADDQYWGFQLNFPFNQTCLDNWEDTIQAESISECINYLPQEKGIAPSFYFPKYLPETSLDDFSFSTKITLQHLSESKFSQLETLLNKLAKSPLMFSGFSSNKQRLGYLSADFDIAGQCQTVNLNIEESRYHLVEVDTSEIIHSSKKHVLEAIDYNLTRNPQLYLAIPVSREASSIEVEGAFHCYLPTELSTHCPIHIHADFYVDNSRKHIDFNAIEYNAYLISLAADALINNLEEYHSLYDIPTICANLMPSSGKLKEELHERFSSGLRLALLIEKLLPYDFEPSIDDINSLWKLIGHYAPVRAHYGRNTVYEQQLARYFTQFSRPNLKIVPLVTQGSQLDDESAPECVPLPKATTVDNQTELFCIIRESNVPTINVMNVTVTAWQFPAAVADSLRKVNVWRNYDDSLTVLRAIIRSQGTHNVEAQRAALLKAAAAVDPIKNETPGIRMSGSERHRSQAILIPAESASGWAKASECYFSSDVLNKCLEIHTGYYRVDERRAADYLGDNYKHQLVFWGAWPVLPIYKNNQSSAINQEWQLPLKASELKEVLSPAEMLDCLAKSFEFWQRGTFFNQNSGLLQAIAKDLYFTEWLEVVEGKDKVISSPEHTFNVSGNQTLFHLPIIRLENIPAFHASLLSWLQVQEIAQETNIKKLIWAAECVVSKLGTSKPRSVSREYKMVVSRLNILRNQIQNGLSNFPRLVTDSSGIRIATRQEIIYFLTSEERRRIRGGYRLELPLLDVPRDTAVEFIEKLSNINRFTPIPVIRPSLDSISGDPTKIDFIADSVLPKLFAYADVAEEINRDPDEDKIKERWSAIDIRVASDGEVIVGIQDPEGNQISSSSLEEDRAVWLTASNSSRAATLILHPKFDWCCHHDLKALSKWMAQELFRIPELQQGFAMTLLDETDIDAKKVEEHRKNIASWLSKDDENDLVASIESLLGKRLEKSEWRLQSTYQGISLCYSRLRQSVPEQLVSAIEHLDPSSNNAEDLKRWLAENHSKLELVVKAEHISFGGLTNGEMIDSFDFNPKLFTLKKLGISCSDLKTAEDSLVAELKELKKGRLDASLPLNTDVTKPQKSTQVNQRTDTQSGSYLSQVRSQSHYAAESEAKAKIGNNAEMQIAIQFSQLVSQLDKELQRSFFTLVVNEYQRLLTEFSLEAEVAKSIEHLLSSTTPSSPIEWYRFLHVGQLCDGCGYDVLGVEPETGHLLLVEVKHSGVTPPVIFLTENERKQIIKYASDDFVSRYPTHKWRLYLTRESRASQDRTEEVMQVIVEQNVTYSQILSTMKATDWFLSFDTL
ncbi:MAG: hypothetical protein L0G88_16190 [Shewanella sp.]|nr:hypothetical protein [Shewanella sp.]